MNNARFEISHTLRRFERTTSLLEHLKMKALRSFETSGNTNSETQRPIPQDMNFEVWTDQQCNISIQIATFSKNVKF
jgi:hypothetical protein